MKDSAPAFILFSVVALRCAHYTWNDPAHSSSLTVKSFVADVCASPFRNHRCLLVILQFCTKPRQSSSLQPDQLFRIRTRQNSKKKPVLLEFWISSLFSLRTIQTPWKWPTFFPPCFLSKRKPHWFKKKSRKLCQGSRKYHRLIDTMILLTTGWSLSLTLFFFVKNCNCWLF